MQKDLWAQEVHQRYGAGHSSAEIYEVRQVMC